MQKSRLASAFLLPEGVLLITWQQEQQLQQQLERMQLQQQLERMQLQQQEQQLQQEQLQQLELQLAFRHKRTEPEPTEQQRERNDSF